MNAGISLETRRLQTQQTGVFRHRSIAMPLLSDFLKMAIKNLGRHLVQFFSGKKHFEKPIPRKIGLTVPHLPCLTNIRLLHPASYNINSVHNFYFAQNKTIFDLVMACTK